MCFLLVLLRRHQTRHYLVHIYLSLSTVRWHWAFAQAEIVVAFFSTKLIIWLLCFTASIQCERCRRSEERARKYANIRACTHTHTHTNWSLILSSATPSVCDSVWAKIERNVCDLLANENSMNSIYFGPRAQDEHNLLIAGAFMVRYRPSSRCKSMIVSLHKLITMQWWYTKMRRANRKRSLNKRLICQRKRARAHRLKTARKSNE